MNMQTPFGQLGQAVNAELAKMQTENDQFNQAMAANNAQLEEARAKALGDFSQGFHGTAPAANLSPELASELKTINTALTMQPFLIAWASQVIKAKVTEINKLIQGSLVPEDKSESES